MIDLGGGIWANEDAIALAPRLDAVIFDVDGVLLNVSESFRKCIAATTQFYLTQTLGWPGGGDYLPVAETELFKRAGGFNSDWALTDAAIVLFLCKAAAGGDRTAKALRAVSPTTEEYTAEIGRRGGGLAGGLDALRALFSPELVDAALSDWNPELVQQVFCEFYAGRSHCRRVYGFEPSIVNQERGELLNERVIIDTASLTDRYRYGIVTGRTRGELSVAMEMTGLGESVHPAATVTADDGLHKPDPTGLVTLAEGIGFAAAAFVGDTLDDMRTVINYRAARNEPAWLACQVLSGPAGEANRSFFAEHGADVIAPDVNSLMRWLESLQPGA